MTSRICTYCITGFETRSCFKDALPAESTCLRISFARTLAKQQEVPLTRCYYGVQYTGHTFYTVPGTVETSRRAGFKAESPLRKLLRSTPYNTITNAIFVLCTCPPLASFRHFRGMGAVAEAFRLQKEAENR